MPGGGSDWVDVLLFIALHHRPRRRANHRAGRRLSKRGAAGLTIRSLSREATPLKSMVRHN